MSVGSEIVVYRQPGPGDGPNESGGEAPSFSNGNCPEFWEGTGLVAINPANSGGSGSLVTSHDEFQRFIRAVNNTNFGPADPEVSRTAELVPSYG
jgi:hypothetical protein